MHLGEESYLSGLTSKRDEETGTIGPSQETNAWGAVEKFEMSYSRPTTTLAEEGQTINPFDARDGSILKKNTIETQLSVSRVNTIPRKKNYPQ